MDKRWASCWEPAECLTVISDVKLGTQRSPCRWSKRFRDTANSLPSQHMYVESSCTKRKHVCTLIGDQYFCLLLYLLTACPPMQLCTWWNHRLRFSFTRTFRLTVYTVIIHFENNLWMRQYYDSFERWTPLRIYRMNSQLSEGSSEVVYERQQYLRKWWNLGWKICRSTSASQPLT